MAGSTAMRRLAALAGAALLALAVASCATQKAPYTGRGQFVIVNDATLAGPSQAFWDKVAAQTGTVQDPAAERLVACIVRRLQGADPKLKALDIRPQVLASQQINAFALPDGHVGVYSGLIRAMPDTDALAFVLAHELAHVLDRHGAEKASWGIAADLGATASRAALNKALGEKNQALQNLAGIAMQVGLPVALLLPNSRTMEAEADKVGQILMSRAGFDPAGGPQAIDALKGGGATLPWLQSHPLKGDRLAALQQAVPQVRRDWPPIEPGPACRSPAYAQVVAGLGGPLDAAASTPASR